MFPKKTSILLVDDMASAREHVKTILTSTGYTEILEAVNGKEAISCLEIGIQIGFPVGLVISDWMMPEMSGLELLKAVRMSAQFKSLPFLMVTAEGEINQVKQAVQLGVSDYIIKPIASDTLWKKLAIIWKKHNPNS